VLSVRERERNWERKCEREWVCEREERIESDTASHYFSKLLPSHSSSVLPTNFPRIKGLREWKERGRETEWERDRQIDRDRVRVRERERERDREWESEWEWERKTEWEKQSVCVRERKSFMCVFVRNGNFLAVK